MGLNVLYPKKDHSRTTGQKRGWFVLSARERTHEAELGTTDRAQHWLLAGVAHRSLPLEESFMSKKAAEHHSKAQEHHTNAARHHGEAAKHHASGQHEKAAHHAHTAAGHAHHARHHSEEAGKAHMEEHGKK